MSAGTPGSLGLEFCLSSSSDTGDVLVTPDFSVTFGDHIAGEGNNGSPSLIGGLVKEAAMAVAVALIAKYLWSKIK